eukprot:scaffold90733_cov41-Prasinocladus_malaysianus.AAC.2
MRPSQIDAEPDSLFADQLAAMGLQCQCPISRNKAGGGGPSGRLGTDTNTIIRTTRRSRVHTYVNAGGVNPQGARHSYRMSTRPVPYRTTTPHKRYRT